MDAIRYVPTGKLLTSLACLRSQAARYLPKCMPLPIRIVPSIEQDGYYEVVDGFKRLRAALNEGKEQIAAVIEEISGPEVKKLLIRANATEKTLTAMDEARVIASLIDQDHLTMIKVARLLERKRPWVSKRLALARRLDVTLHKAVDENRLPVSLAYGLTVFHRNDQLQLAEAIMTGGLSATNGHALLTTYRGLDARRQKDLLNDPLGMLEELVRASARQVVPLTSAARRRMENYRQLARLLDEFGEEALPAVSPAEARLLEAERRMTEARIITVAQGIVRMPSGAQEVMP